MNNPSSERGSVLFFILIAVALLAALAFAVTQGSRDSTGSLSTDRQRLLATEIIDYGNTVKSAVIMLRLRGIAADSLSFAAPGVGSYGTAPTAEIFNPAGGAVVYKIPAPEALTSQTGVFGFSDADEVAGIGSTCGALSCAETILWINNVNTAVCTEINNQIGIANNGSNPPASAATVDSTGTATDYNTILNDAVFTGKNAACGTFGGGNAYYQVLLAR